MTETKQTFTAQYHAPHLTEMIISGVAQAAASDSSEDVVNHPSHYCSHPSGIECITITRHMPFNTGNVVKYLWRSGLKDPTKEIEDLKKARFYLDDEIKRLEGKQ